MEKTLNDQILVELQWVIAPPHSAVGSDMTLWQKWVCDYLMPRFGCIQRYNDNDRI